MDIALADWLNLVFRWLHLITGIAWIGASFYFIALDLGLRKRAGLPPGVYGESWNVHGGGFYLMQKYTVAPEQLPEELHWFKWEAYFTFISGFALMSVIYYWSAESFLIDKEVADISQLQAIALSIGFLAGGWIVYDLLCRAPVLKNNSLVLALAVFLLILAVAVGTTNVFSGRAAFVHVGAVVGTIMVGNVFFIIIPNQKIVVADLRAGREPDPRLGAEGKQRSTHNNYLTLPVLLMMTSSHFPMIFGHKQSWVVVALILIVGGIIRDYFNRMNGGETGKVLKWQWPTATVFMLLLVGFISYQPAAKIDPDAKMPVASDALAIVQVRCASCHSSKPTDADFDQAPGGVKFDTVEELRKYSARILKQAVLTNAMPLANKTKITRAERDMLGLWIRSGMPDDEK
jgi:uncharacterized membrane protein